jgi:hypothetical protein
VKTSRLLSPLLGAAWRFFVSELDADSMESPSSD